MSTALGDEILALRAAGHNYNYIMDKLGCSKGTVSYHCGPEQKKRTKERLRAHRKQAHPLVRKLQQFMLPTVPKKPQAAAPTTAYRSLYIKIIEFCRTSDGPGRRYTNMTFTVEDLLAKIGDDPRCALTGRPIDLRARATYALDHIVPRARGGDNTLDNCQIVCRDANQAKHKLLTDEFVQLCRDVVQWAERQNIPR